MTEAEYDKLIREADQDYQKALRSGHPEAVEAMSQKLNGIKAERDAWRKSQQGTPAQQSMAEQYKAQAQSQSQAAKNVPSENKSQNTAPAQNKLVQNTSASAQNTGTQNTKPINNQPENDNLTDRGYPGSRGDGWKPNNGNLTDKGFPGSRDGGEGAIYHGKDESDSETPEENTKKKTSVNTWPGFSASFYRDLNAMVTGRPVGNRQDVRADTYNQLMHQKNNEAARQDMMSQDAMQRGTRNEYAEAGKEASFKNDTMNRQLMNQTAFTGANRGRIRQLTEPNVQNWRDYGTQQRKLGGEYADTADTNRERGIEFNGESKEWRLGSRDYDRDLNESYRLSMGRGVAAGKQNPVPDQKPQKEPEPQQTEPEQPAPQNDDPESYNTNWHNVLNYITFGNDQTSGWSNDSKDGGNARKYAEAHGWKPVTMSQAQWDAEGVDAEGIRQQIVAEQNPDFYAAWQEGSKRFDENGNQTNAGDNGATVEQFQNQSGINHYACGTGNAKPGYAVVGEKGPEVVKFNGGEKVYPNYQGFLDEICDERCKNIKARYDNGEELSNDDLMFLADRAGAFGDFDLFDHKDDEEYDDDVLSGYANHIRNYLYNYKPGAENIDPRIDSSEEHIGPMAQDIEKVNPACVKETPEGVKTVDTARLAMMNAGAIGDLARQMKDLAAKLEALNG